MREPNRRRPEGVSFPATRSPWRYQKSADDSIPVAALYVRDTVADTLQNLLMTMALQLANSAFGERRKDRKVYCTNCSTEALGRLAALAVATFES